MDVHHGIFIYVSLKISSTLYYFVISSIRQNNWNKLCFSFSSRWYFFFMFCTSWWCTFSIFGFSVSIFLQSHSMFGLVLLQEIHSFFLNFRAPKKNAGRIFSLQATIFVRTITAFHLFFWLRLRIFFASSSNDFLFLGGIGMENWSWSSRKILFWMMIMMLTGKNYHPLEQFLE